MGTYVADCFRLAYKGGPERESWRGMTLWGHTQYLDDAMAQLADINSLVAAQAALVERSLRIYGERSKGYHQNREALVALQQIQTQAMGLPRKEIAHRVLDVLVDFEHAIGPT